MKRSKKFVFFIVALLIVGLAYTTFFGVYTHYGDRRDTIIRGAKDIRWGIDISGGVDATFGPEKSVKNVTSAQLESIKDVISQRLVANNITDYEIYTDSNNKQVIVRFPWQNGEKDFNVSEALDELGKTAALEFHIGSTTETKKDSEGNSYESPTGDLVLTGTDVESAQALYDQKTGEPVVQLKLKNSGKQKFSDATKKQLASKGTISIWLDHDKISDPTVEAQITDGVATISHGFKDSAEATKLANLINSGALPFNIEVKESGSITPTMGSRSLNVMLLAGVIAFTLVSLFMLLYYRLSGFVAIISLLGQVAGCVAVVSGYFGVFHSFTLTLPGIAGIILSMGMGVDANIIMAERIKEQIRAGKTIDGAVASGSKESFWAIFDGNITNVIVAIVLMGVFGPPDGFWATLLKPVLFMFPSSTTGAVYSFGFTLFAGIIFNFIMGVAATRLMTWSLTRFKCLRKPWLLGGGKVKEKKQFAFVGNRKYALMLSGLVLAIGIVCNIAFGTQMDVSFKGGTNIKMSYTGQLDENSVQSFAKSKLGNNAKAELTPATGGINTLNVYVTDKIDAKGTETFVSAMQKQYPDNKVTSLETQALGATMSRLFFIKCLVALALAAVFLLIYVALRFRKIGGFSAAVMGIAALIHDCLIAYFAFVIFRIPLDGNFVAVMMTILGYSLNDTIVIYDRIRSNRRIMGAKASISEITNLSINQCFARSMNTSISTFGSVAVIVVVALICGVTSIMSFALPMMIGVISGCYSSTFLCTPLWVSWAERIDRKKAEKSKLHRSGKSKKSAAKA